MVTQQRVSTETGGGAAPSATKPDPNACLCCGKWALAHYARAELGKVCADCVYEAAQELGMLKPGADW